MVLSGKDPFFGAPRRKGRGESGAGRDSGVGAPLGDTRILLERPPPTAPTAAFGYIIVFNPPVPKNYAHSISVL